MRGFWITQSTVGINSTQEHQQAQYRFAGQQREIPQANAPILDGQPQEKVNHAEYYLSHEEIIVHKTAGKNQQSEHAAPLSGHVFIQRPQEQRENDDGLVKVVEEDIVHRKAGERIEQTRPGPHSPAYGRSALSR